MWGGVLTNPQIASNHDGEESVLRDVENVSQFSTIKVSYTYRNCAIAYDDKTLHFSGRFEKKKIG